MFTRIPREKPLHTRERRFILRDIEQVPALFEEHEVTLLDPDEGAKTITETDVYQAGCGHLIGLVGPAELIATCGQCGATLCVRCGNLRCMRCLELLCSEHARVVDGCLIYCGPCRVKVLTKRIAVKLLGGLHALLSKEPSK